MRQAKVFFLICAGVLILTVALEIATDTALAEYDPNAPGPFVGVSGNSVLLGDGEVWVINEYWDGEPLYWERREAMDPPIPLGQIKHWEGIAFLTTSGEYWILDWTAGQDGEWVNMGTPPGTSVQATDWSQLKTQFGR